MNSIVVTSTKQNIKFGYEGEDNVTKIIFPYDESWLEYGEGNFEVRILRCGDEVAYTATEVVDDRQAMTLTMTVTDIELSVRGRGEMQLCYVCPDCIKKSPIYQYTVNRSVDYKYAVDPPEGSIIASVEKSLSEIKNTTNRLSNSVISIESSIDDVNSQIDNINNKISEFDEEIDSIGEVETKVDNLETSAQSINRRINTAEGNINENTESISNLNESVTELENRKVTDLETSGGRSDSGKYLTVDANGKVKATSLVIPTITVDASLSTTSTNPVQNKVIKTELNNINSNIATCNTEISKINGSLGDVKANLKECNGFDYLQNATRTNKTHNGVIYTWTGKTCKLVGTSTDISNNVLVAQSNAFSGDFVGLAGKTIIVYYSGVVSSLNVRFYKNGSKTIILDKYVRGVQMIDVPSDAEGIVIRLFLSAGNSIDETVNMCVCSSGTIDIVEDVLHPIKFTSAIASADLNDQPIQTIAVDTGSGTLHSPLTNSAAYVFTLGTTSLSRIQYWVSYITGKTFYRRYLSGTWYNWIEMKNGDTYENTYTTEYHENTYNIECTPTITSDTNNYLASTGDTTDRTGDIQTMLNTTGVCRLGPGVFYTTGVEIPNYGALIGSGKKTQIILASSVTNGYAVKLRTYSTVKDVCILGNVNAITPSSTVGTRHGIVFEGTADAQSSPQTFYRSYITGCLIRNFAGGGITCRNTGLSPAASLVVSDCQIANCDAGINVSYFSEFHRWTNVTAQECYYGCICNGGNNNFANCDFSMNKQALLIDNSTGQSRNNTHGTFSACTFHHSANAYSGGAIVSVGTCMQILGATAGEIFTGCQIGYGNIEIDDSVGIRFDSCNFLRMTALEITDSPLVVFSDCNFWDSTSSPLTQSGNTTLKFHDCYLDNGTAFDPMTS